VIDRRAQIDTATLRRPRCARVRPRPRRHPRPGARQR